MSKTKKKRKTTIKQVKVVEGDNPLKLMFGKTELGRINIKVDGEKETQVIITKRTKAMKIGVDATQ